ncbi:Fc.00g073970.m01.CDS01 [Cosmosporella sp. VM-42]
MPKLSPSLKALINAPFARPGPRAAPAKIQDVYQSIAREAAQRNLGQRPWLAISAAATFTLNSPDSLPILHRVASGQKKDAEVQTAEFIREIGLKCISFNGIPRTINCLNSFYASLPETVTSNLSTTPSRQPTPWNIDITLDRGQKLWDSIYAPFEKKLFDKLALSHPDLPVYILSDHYSALLSDPAERESLASVGRVLTSMVAVSCLRAQTGVGPQVLSHVFGLRKSFEDGTYQQDNIDAEDEAVKWLATDEGGEWILKTVDRIVETIGGSSFAPSGRESKL